MNKFKLFLLLATSTIYGQEYIFNTATIYISTYKNVNHEIVTYSNATNDSYCIYLTKDYEYLTAYLHDYQTMKTHKFAVLQTKIKEEFQYKFEYQYTVKMETQGSRKFSSYVYSFETLSSSDTNKIVKFNIYKNSKKRKLTDEYELEIKNNDENLFPAFRMSCIHPHEFNAKINTFEKGVVVKSTRKSADESSRKFELKELNTVDFKVQISE